MNKTNVRQDRNIFHVLEDYILFLQGVQGEIDKLSLFFQGGCLCSHQRCHILKGYKAMAAPPT